MYPNAHVAAPAQQGRSVAPETFLLDQDAQQSLPPEAILALQQVDNLKYFLISAPVDWSPEQVIRRFLLPTGEYISCVLWNTLFHISGTDIVRCLSFRFQAFGRPVKNPKKFEEGIFSDLRNLKSGTDASLEEPKSPFLDFLYKNNCIRTQKKQKVFYWYSVPHDRLFLDALERDLKREKMGQEATTVAVAEPALSFEYDSSQSLFEQLTKAQQTNSSSFNPNLQSFQQPPPQMIREVDSMPPPSIIQQQMPVPVTVAEETMAVAQPFTTMSMANNVTATAVMKSREQYDRNGVPLSQIHLRHTSVPAFMDTFSPAPSLAMSHYDDFSTSRMSFEPLTPPQSQIGMGAETAYIANEETGLYSAMPELGVSAPFNPLMQMTPQNPMVGPGFSNVTRTFPAPNVYSVIEGSPTYKQRRRRSSLSTGITAAIAAQANQPHRPSDLRRSMSASVVPVPEADESQQNSPQSVAGVQPNQQQQQQPYSQQQVAHDFSRHGTPLATVEQSPIQEHTPIISHDELNGLSNGAKSDYSEQQSQGGQQPQLQHSALARTAIGAGAGGPGVFRRARSATMMELGPYPQKSHSCPIPSCGRLFKRLEHLKRHVRTHTQERPYVCTLCGKAFSRSDNLAQHRRIHEQQQNGENVENFSEEDLEEGQDQLGNLEEESPQSEHAYINGSIQSQQMQPPQQPHHAHHGSMNGYHHMPVAVTSAGVSLGEVVAISPAMAMSSGASPHAHAHAHAHSHSHSHSHSHGHMGPPAMMVGQNY